MGLMALTQKDLNAIRNLIGLEIDEKLETKLEEKLKTFPTKEEFFSKMDEGVEDNTGRSCCPFPSGINT